MMYDLDINLPIVLGYNVKYAITSDEKTNYLNVYTNEGYFMNNIQPFCSIIVLNYFGERVIKNTIESLLNLDYPKHKFEIIIVDNNSTDKSRNIIIDYVKKYNNIKNLFLNKNLGFAGGNNSGLKIAQGEYVALLNNDCVANKSWLSELVKTVQKDPEIFAVSSKIMLFPRYYKLKFCYKNSLFLERISLNNSYLSVLAKPKKLFLDMESEEGVGFVEIPYSPDDQIISVEIIFEIGQRDLPKFSKGLFTLLNKDGVIGEIKKSISENRLMVEIKCDVRKFSQKNIYEKIQNAGIVVFQDGSGRDIGAKIVNQKQYYEHDLGQYSVKKEIYAACGAAVLYNKKILDEIGFLDELFFMYYEDVEISERARLRGYKIYYSPKAEVRHLHAFSSGEWSNFFIYQAEKGKLLHVFFNFPSSVFAIEYLKVILKIMEIALRIFKSSFDFQRMKKFIKSMMDYLNGKGESGDNNKTDFGKAIQYIKIVFYFVINMPFLLVIKYKKNKDLTKRATEKNYNEIIEGKWYFK